MKAAVVDIPYTAPKHNQGHFNCPYPNCRAYAQQMWGKGMTDWPYRAETSDRMTMSRCAHCKQDAFWLDGRLIEPVSRSAPFPNNDLSPETKRDYNEAANIEQMSPKGAAALLRLCLQRLCKDLGERGENINADIAALVKKGLPVEIQQALDVVRVVGNNAVHPGAIDLDDNPETVSALFTLINAIADRMITQPNKVKALYGTLPPGIVESIEKRDKPKE